MTYQRVSLDLLGDQDIQSMLKKSYSLEDLTVPSDEWEDESIEESDSGSERDIVSYKSLDVCDGANNEDSDKENDKTYENSENITGQDTLVSII